MLYVTSGDAKKSPNPLFTSKQHVHFHYSELLVSKHTAQMNHQIGVTESHTSNRKWKREQNTAYPI